MIQDYVDGYPGMGAATGQYASSAVLALWVGGLGYVAYKILGRTPRRKSKPKSKSSKRSGSRARRRAKATTKRLYWDRRDGTMKQKASDWVAEQERKQRRLTGKKKSLRYATA